jgi:cell division protein FtsB
MTARRETDFGRIERDKGAGAWQPQPGSLAMRTALVLGAAGLLFSLLVAQLGDGGLPAMFRLRERAAELRTEAAGLRTDIAVIEANRERLRTDREYLERIAREWYGMKGPNEMVIHMPARTAP